MKRAAILIAATCAALSCSATAQPRLALSLVPPARLRCLATRQCDLRVEARGGEYPLHWRLREGVLPPGMTLDPQAGIMSGKPSAGGEYHATIEATDSSQPPQRAARDVVIIVVSLLSVEWRSLPALRDTTISGSLRVTNDSGDEVVLTVVVVAVSEIGKAYTLGYQHFPLRTGNTSPDIPFSMAMPSGRYRVRADAVGEVYDKNLIYRSSGEAGPLVVP